MNQLIRRRHPSSLPFIYPIARWCPWGKWSPDGRVLLNPNDKVIHPVTPKTVYGYR